MDVVEATTQYDAWLAGRLAILADDVAYKHHQMKKDSFRFLRGSFYRWMQRWPELAGDLSRTFTVLSIGDLHVENFGTWRDAEGRLVWGVNDFDEAYPLAWTQDLVRLATSAHLAVNEAHLQVRRGDACDAILEGYVAGIRDGGGPFVLAEQHAFLREIALGRRRDPEPFWAELTELPELADAAPEARAILERALPDACSSRRFVHRIAGLGSLGRQRVAVTATWHGALIAREVKALAPSAAAWSLGKTDDKIYCQDLLDSAIRSRDPFVRVSDGWVLRRLAPDCMRIDLKDLPSERDERELLRSMGYETANVHLGTEGARAQISRELADRAPGWLHSTAKQLARAVKDDWEAWRRRDAP